MACDTIKVETLDADEVVSIVTQGPQGPSGAEAATLTTTGDLLYRAALANDRLPIGSEGQVLKVSSGLPAWGNESGAVTSVNGETGAVVLDAADVGAAPIFSQINVEITDDYVVSPSRALILSVRNLHQNQANIRLPLASASVAGDVIVIANSSNSLYETLNVQYFFTGPSIWVTLNTINRGEQKRYILPTAGSWSLVSVDTHTHAASDITSGTLDIARIPTGTGSTQVALGDHTHTQLHDKSHAMTDATSHTAGNHKVFYSDGSGQIQELALGNSGEVLTSNGATSAPSFAAASGGIGGSTGATDGAILRADGTGGSTSQSSDLVIDDATTSTQNNVTISNQHSGQTNSALVLQPKGTGAFILGPKPDGAATVGGNARGDGAIDLQMERNGATAVASGNYAFAAGRRNTASSDTSVAIGFNNVASTGAYAVAIGRNNTASANSACCIGGQFNTASGSESAALSGNTNTASAVFAVTLGGNYSLADRGGMIAQCNGRFAATGDAQWIHMVLRAKTTTNSAVELLINSDRTTNGRLTCPSGKVISGIINIHGVKSDGTASAHYVRQFQVKNVGGTSSYPYTAATVGTDYASSTSITFNDPDTNGDALSVSVTGIASETWRWTAHVSAVETTYGS